MSELSANKAQYNNCFVLGSKMWNTEKKRLIKVPMYIDSKGWPKKLYGGKDGELRKFYELSYEEADQALKGYWAGRKRASGGANLRVSLYLDNAMYGNLHVFLIDFDKFDEKSEFFIKAKGLADKVTRSQGGGYHMFYGIDKNVATQLFVNLNLLTSDYAKSYISSTGNVTLDEANKVDFFCDAYHLMYEWEPWDNTVGLTDKTQSLYELISGSFSIKRSRNTGQGGSRRAASNKIVLLDEKDELELLPRMSDRQQKVFDNLKMISSDCPREEWFRIGIDIWHVFGDNLGGDVFRYWSEPGESFNPQGCAVTWGNIMECGPDTNLWNDTWREMFNAFDT
ncbi:PriCT-2 domain-containing protein [Acutalibacter muris]|jgi:hypothetical protein|uniref:PriCT-2 domain-containing protein n=1 Tax=Acutalibacter muris TaxID=1796620 RepID=UPI0026F3D119|nr:PriCT-2 domain-containing protein [Acutalibacter muris]